MIAEMHTDVTVNQKHSRDGKAVAARLVGVSKSYGPVRALRSVDFSIRQGELIALLGPNGAGKTTAVKLFLGLSTPDTGTVSVFGGNPKNSTTRMRTGAMLQVAKVPETMRVREHIDLFRSYYPNPLSIEQTMSIAGVADIRERLFGDLSGGQRQRVLFALALCGDPDLVFLDEPTVGMDVEARRVLWEQIRRLVARGKTILLTTHYLEEADALADRVAVINKGEIIAEGTPAEIKARTSGQKIRCMSRLSLDEVRQIPGVITVTRDRDALEIRAASAEPVLRELFLRDAMLGGLEVSSAGLEEAFLALTAENETK
jgi:ABC-2 type transport system ATP-binding protein